MKVKRPRMLWREKKPKQCTGTKEHKVAQVNILHRINYSALWCVRSAGSSANSSKEGSAIPHLHTLGVYQGVDNKTQIIIIVVFK